MAHPHLTIQNPGTARALIQPACLHRRLKIRIIPPARASRPHRYNSRPIHCRRARIICNPTRRRRIGSAALLASIRLAARPHTPSEIGRCRCPPPPPIFWVSISHLLSLPPSLFSHLTNPIPFDFEFKSPPGGALALLPNPSPPKP